MGFLQGWVSELSLLALCFRRGVIEFGVRTTRGFWFVHVCRKVVMAASVATPGTFSTYLWIAIVVTQVCLRGTYLIAVYADEASRRHTLSPAE